jgi:hypothetical protein
MIVVLCTGGTMSKDYPKSTMGYAFEFGDESAADRILKRVPKQENFVVERVCAKVQYGVCFREERMCFIVLRLFSRIQRSSPQKIGC